MPGADRVVHRGGEAVARGPSSVGRWKQARGCAEIGRTTRESVYTVRVELAYHLLLSVSRRERTHARASAAFRVLKAFSVGVPGPGNDSKQRVEGCSTLQPYRPRSRTEPPAGASEFVAQRNH